MNRWVEIQFDCLPLRSVARWDVPIDASPKYAAFCAELKQAAEKHGAHNTYFLHNAHCTFHLTNQPEVGMVEFQFSGVILTDEADRHACGSDLQIHLGQETCPWMTEPVVEWFRQTVSHAVETEFDRYIDAGDLERTRERIQKLRAASDEAEGFLGMYL